MLRTEDDAKQARLSSSKIINAKLAKGSVTVLQHARLLENYVHQHIQAVLHYVLQLTGVSNAGQPQHQQGPPWIPQASQWALPRRQCCPLLP